MFKTSDKNALTLTRGNTAAIDITPINKDDETPIILNDGDSVLFTVKNFTNKVVIQKKLTNKDYDGEEDKSLNCILDPADTINLRPGDYNYDCLLLSAGGQAYTFIASRLTILAAYGTYLDAKTTPDSDSGDDNGGSEEPPDNTGNDEPAVDGGDSGSETPADNPIEDNQNADNGGTTEGAGDGDG